jgi:nicotinate-nucleotide adenylyltransferase
MIGIYGGTFNPVHFGHLRTALEVKELFNLKQMRLIPCHLPSHRHQPCVSGNLRMEMLKLAISDSPGLQVDSCELDRQGPSYMLDTLKILRQELGEHERLLLFMGADVFDGLERWHLWQQLFQYAHIVVMTRPGYTSKLLADFFQQRLIGDSALLQSQAFGCVFFQAVTQLDISATKIRQIFATGGNPQFLLPDKVISFIREHQLYQSQN